MGRAPATALAYMFYCRLIPLEQALQQIRAVRACNPRVIAVRQAACDILVDAGTRQKCCISVARAGTASQVQVSPLRMLMNLRFSKCQQHGVSHSPCWWSPY